MELILKKGCKQVEDKLIFMLTNIEEQNWEKLFLSPQSSTRIENSWRKAKFSWSDYYDDDDELDHIVLQDVLVPMMRFGRPPWLPITLYHDLSFLCWGPR